LSGFFINANKFLTLARCDWRSLVDLGLGSRCISGVFPENLINLPFGVVMIKRGDLNIKLS
jgi:hypothetical protein